MIGIRGIMKRLSKTPVRLTPFIKKSKIGAVQRLAQKVGIQYSFQKDGKNHESFVLSFWIRESF